MKAEARRVEDQNRKGQSVLEEMKRGVEALERKNK